MDINLSQPLNCAQVSKILDTTSNILRIQFSGLPKETLNWHFDPNEWCIQQVLGHLIETERSGFADRILKMIVEKDPQLISLDQVAEAHIRNDCDRDGFSLLEEFCSLRNSSCEIVKNLKETDLQRGAWHPDVGYITVSDLLHEWIYHDMDHLRQIMNNVQHLTWSHLGKTQQFYE